MNKIDALKVLGYKYLTKNKYSENNPQNNYVVAWKYKPQMLVADDLSEGELIYWTNGKECTDDLWATWTQINIQNDSDFDCVNEDNTEPYIIE